MDNEIVSVKRKDVGDKRFAEIARLGGFGNIGGMQEQLDPNSTLDLTGVLDEKNKAIDPEDRARIREILLESGTVETVESLVKANSKEELSKMAVEVGLDGNSFTNKAEMAEAIIAKRNEQPNA